MTDYDAMAADETRRLVEQGIVRRTDADLARMRTLSTAELQAALSYLHGRLDGNETTRAIWTRALDYATEAKQ